MSTSGEELSLNSTLHPQQQSKFIEEEGEEEKKSTEKHSPVKQKRRTRSDSEHRDFICGCSKAYLSYPALYTHLKQKHDGKQPPGTLMPNSSIRGSRGRPKTVNKLDKASSSRAEEDQFSLMSNEKSEDSGDDGKSEKWFTDYLEKLEKQFGQKLRDDKLNGDEEKAKCSLYFPIDAFKYYSDCSIIHQIVEKLCEDEKELCNEEDVRTSGDSELREMKINEILSRFLVHFSKKVTSKFFKTLCIIVCLYRKMLNRVGWKILRELQEEKELEEGHIIRDEEEFCSVNNGKHIIEACNHFIANLNQLVKEFINQKEEYVLLENIIQENEKDEKKEHHGILIHIIKIMASWLFDNYYTTSVLAYNKIH